MHPHTADFLVNDHIDAIMGEATRARIARAGKRSASRQAAWRERVLEALRRRTTRRGLGSVARHA